MLEHAEEGVQEFAHGGDQSLHLGDFKGNKIPVTATDGSVTWIRLDDVPVSGRVMVISRTAGVASSYDCCVCQCPMSATGQLTVSPAPIDLAPTGGASASSTATLTECNQYYEYCDETGSSTWSSGNTSVATVNSSARVTAVAGGSANINASYSGTEYYWYQPQGRCVAQSIPCNGSSTCNVCDFQIQGYASSANCNSGAKTETEYEAVINLSSCTVYEPSTKLTFGVGGSVQADYTDSYIAYPSGVPVMYAYYFEGPSAGSVTPQFTIQFDNGTQVSHQKTDSVCQ